MPTRSPAESEPAKWASTVSSSHPQSPSEGTSSQAWDVRGGRRGSRRSLKQNLSSCPSRDKACLADLLHFRVTIKPRWQCKVGRSLGLQQDLGHEHDETLQAGHPSRYGQGRRKRSLKTGV